MPVAVQIALGSAMILVCAGVEIAFAAAAIAGLKRRKPFEPTASLREGVTAVSGVFLLFLVAHTLHIYLWAFAFWAIGALAGYETPIYFALVSYSTLGYGDVTLASDFRIFGAMASICGVLMFGLTTAFLVGMFTRLLST
jgi:hypothetical protein